MPALEDPQTRAALAALRVGALRWLAGGLVAVVLGVVLGSAVVHIARDGGERPPGVGLVVVALVLGGLVATVVGLGALVRTRRWGAALAGTSWRTGRLRLAGTAVLRVEPLGFDELAGDSLHLRLMSTAVWRTRAVQRLADADISYAPVGPREWVLTADGAGTVYGAREVGRRG